jgi:hypothetical protein
MSPMCATLIRAFARLKVDIVALMDLLLVTCLSRAWRRVPLSSSALSIDAWTASKDLRGVFQFHNGKISPCTTSPRSRTRASVSFDFVPLIYRFAHWLVGGWQ